MYVRNTVQFFSEGVNIAFGSREKCTKWEWQVSNSFFVKVDHSLDHLTDTKRQQMSLSTTFNEDTLI